MIKIENDHLLIEVKELGAELVRVYSKSLNKELLWKGDSKFWGRHSPILFPIVGRLKDNETFIDGVKYNMCQHGFARDMEFQVEEVSETSVTLKLSANEATKELFPYAFELIVKYILGENEVKVLWKVVNTDLKEIYFSIGAHPAFNLEGELQDYYLEFSKEEEVEQIFLQGPYNCKREKVEAINSMDLRNELFSNDALIYTNINAIALKSRKSNHFIKINFQGFPLVGIWTPYYEDTKTTAPFLCLEPWYGLCDSVHSNKEFKDKPFINQLNIGEVFKASYNIVIK